MKSIKQVRTWQHWLARSHIFIIVAGIILYFASYPIAYLAVVSNYTQSIEHVELDVAVWAIYVMIIGIVWGVVKSGLFGALYRFFTEKVEL